MIAPDRELAQQFVATLPQTRAFQILADLKSYPPQQTLEIRLRQLKPHVILLDLASRPGGRERADPVSSPRLTPPVHVVGLHTHNDSDRDPAVAAGRAPASFCTRPSSRPRSATPSRGCAACVQPEAPVDRRKPGT